jgi:hypothetical protein
MLVGSLKDTVRSIEKEEAEGFPAWFSVGGSLLSGLLISHRQMVRTVSELMMDKASVAEQAELSILTDALLEKEREYAEQVSFVESAHLVDVAIIHGDKELHSPFAVIELNLVGAWGLGNVQDEF